MENKEWRATEKHSSFLRVAGLPSPPLCGTPLVLQGLLAASSTSQTGLFGHSYAADGFAASLYLPQGTKSVSQVAYRYGHPPTSLQTCTNVPPNVHMRARNFGNALSEFRPIRRTCRHFVSHLRLFPCRMFLSSETVKNFQFFQFFQFFRLFASFWFFESFFPHVSYLIFPQTV